MERIINLFYKMAQKVEQYSYLVHDLVKIHRVRHFKKKIKDGTASALVLNGNT